MAVLTGQTSYSSDLNLEITEIGKLIPEARSDPIERSRPRHRPDQRTIESFNRHRKRQSRAAKNNVRPIGVGLGGLRFSLNDERFAIENLALTLYDGKLTGIAALPRQGEDKATIKLQFEEALDLASMANDLAGRELELAGEITGGMDANVPRQQLADLAKWEASANVSVESGTAWGLAIDRAKILLELQKGVVSLSETGLTWANSSLDLSGNLSLAEPQAFAADVKLAAGDLKDLNQISGDLKFPVSLAGSLGAKATVKGQFEEFQWKANGSMTSSQLTFDKVVFDAVSAEMEATPEAVSLPSFDAKLYDGTMTGQGRYPLQPKLGGEFQFDWREINLGRLVPLYSKLQTPVNGLVSGKAVAKLEAGPAPGPWNAQAEFQMPAITIGAIEAGNLKGRLDYNDQRLDYKILGNLFEGDFELSGKYPDGPATEAAAEPPPLPGQGRIELKNLQLKPAAQVFAESFNELALTGQVSVTFAWLPGNLDESQGSGSIAITDLAWNQNRITDRLAGEFSLRGNRIRADKLEGMIAGTEIEAEAVWGLGTDRTRLLVLRAANLNTEFFADLAQVPKQLVKGRFDVEVKLIPLEIWQFDARLKAPQLTLAGVAFQSVTLPIRGTARPSFDRGELRIRSLAASFAGGRVRGQVSLGWGDRRYVQSELNVTKVDTVSLVRQLWGSDLPGDGKLSGTIRLDGKKLRNWSDLNAEIDATLSRCQPRKLPIVEAFSRTISLSQPVEEGKIKARYARGAVRISELALRGPTLEMLMDGDIAANQRLNLNLIIKTGRRSLDRRISHLIGGRLGERVIGVLADRLIGGKVTGTIHRPIVHVKPLSLVNIKAVQ